MGWVPQAALPAHPQPPLSQAGAAGSPTPTQTTPTPRLSPVLPQGHDPPSSVPSALTSIPPVVALMLTPSITLSLGTNLPAFLASWTAWHEEMPHVHSLGFPASSSWLLKSPEPTTRSHRLSGSNPPFPTSEALSAAGDYLQGPNPPLFCSSTPLFSNLLTTPTPHPAQQPPAHASPLHHPLRTPCQPQTSLHTLALFFPFRLSKPDAVPPSPDSHPPAQEHTPPFPPFLLIVSIFLSASGSVPSPTGMTESLCCWDEPPLGPMEPPPELQTGLSCCVLTVPPPKPCSSPNLSCLQM